MDTFNAIATTITIIHKGFPDDKRSRGEGKVSGIESGMMMFIWMCENAISSDFTHARVWTLEMWENKEERFLIGEVSF